MAGGGEAVGALLALGAIGLTSLAFWLKRRKRQGKPTLLDPDLFSSIHFKLGVSGQMLQQITLGGMMIAIPIFLQIALEYDAMKAGLSIAPLSLSMFFIALLAGKRAGKRRSASIIRAGFALPPLGSRSSSRSSRAESGWDLFIPLVIVGVGLGLLVSQLNNYTLAPIEEERVSEAAGVNSAAGSFGLSFGLAMAGGIMLAALSISFTSMSDNSDVTHRIRSRRSPTHWRMTLRSSATRNSRRFSPGNPRTSRPRSSASTTTRAPALQVALLVPLLACLFGLFASFRMVRRRDIEPSAAAEGMLLG